MTVRAVRRWLRSRWLLLLSGLMLVYFGYHAVHGNRGLLAWLDVSRALEAGRAELAAITAQNAELQAGVDALRPDRADPDLLDEELRRLGYVGEREIVILPNEPPPAAGARPAPAEPAPR